MEARGAYPQLVRRHLRCCGRVEAEVEVVFGGKLIAPATVQYMQSDDGNGFGDTKNIQAPTLDIRLVRPKEVNADGNAPSVWNHVFHDLG